MVGRITKPGPACEELTEHLVTSPLSLHLPLPEPEGTPRTATHLGLRKEGREAKLEIYLALLQSPPHPPSIEKRERRLVSVLRRSWV